MEDGLKMIQLFDRAKRHIKNPKLRIAREVSHADGTNTVVEFAFIRGGPNSREPGCIHITDGRPFGTNTYYGVIHRTGSLELRYGNDDEREHIKSIIKNPVEESKISGLKYKYCCFCGLELTNASSLHYGYGPICAENWDLPWGNVPEKDIGDIEIDIAPEEICLQE